MIVADVNLVAYLLIQGNFTDDVQALYRQDSDWKLPSLWRHEFLNILSKYAQYDGIAKSKANQLLSNALDRFMSCESPVDYQDALAISVQKGITAYDAQYVSLAKQLGVKLITYDKKIIQTFPKISQRPETA
jgi:predicted nucleic acid-binding protein